jgi:hypothetical protein
MTRLTAMYQSRDAERVGPVRSARYPNIWMVQMFGGMLACSGGSDAIRYLLKNEVGFPYLDADIDDPSNNRYFMSLGSDYRTRMQARTDGARQWLVDQASRWTGTSPVSPLATSRRALLRGDATVIAIPYPGGNSVEWRYDPAQGGYLRFQGGQQQFDPATNQPIVAANVVVQSAVHELTDIVEDSLGHQGRQREAGGVWRLASLPRRQGLRGHLARQPGDAPALPRPRRTANRVEARPELAPGRTANPRHQLSIVGWFAARLGQRAAPFHPPVNDREESGTCNGLIAHCLRFAACCLQR